MCMLLKLNQSWILFFLFIIICVSNHNTCETDANELSTQNGLYLFFIHCAIASGHFIHIKYPNIDSTKIFCKFIVVVVTIRPHLPLLSLSLSSQALIISFFPKFKSLPLSFVVLFVSLLAKHCLFLHQK